MSWQTIDTAPIGEEIIIVDSEGNMDICTLSERCVNREKYIKSKGDTHFYKTVKEILIDCDSLKVFCPTHWMPAPAKPLGGDI